MYRYLKNLAKHYLLPLRMRHRMHPSIGISQRTLFLQYQQWIKDGRRFSLDETGFKVFSQHEEDGQILFLLAALDISQKVFVDIGSNDGVNSNCANLALHFGWHGLFIDSDSAAIRRGTRFYHKYPDPWSYKPVFKHAEVTPASINTMITEAGISGEIGLLSIDIDGHDYWIWKAIDCIQPAIVLVEANVEMGLNDSVVPYNAAYNHKQRHACYHGASVTAFCKLADRKGYRLAGANQYGHNLFFIRKEVPESLIPTCTPESVLQHPSAVEAAGMFQQIADWPLEKGG